MVLAGDRRATGFEHKKAATTWGSVLDGHAGRQGGTTDGRENDRPLDARRTRAVIDPRTGFGFHTTAGTPITVTAGSVSGHAFRPSDFESITLDFAESNRPLMLFEFVLPARYDLPRADVIATLEPSVTATVCAYKGHASHWSLPGAGDKGVDTAWITNNPRSNLLRSPEWSACIRNVSMSSTTRHRPDLSHPGRSGPRRDVAGGGGEVGAKGGLARESQVGNIPHLRFARMSRQCPR
ncbi:DUF427 domain-containing protein [Rhodococcus tibetensis]|uniref:DUF427 domain-containing protein n=1 Tax=Rhodococcus tibetensis TaxID=2965064 RepID=UPI0035ABEB71